MSNALATTPLHPWHKSHGARLAEFAGFEMPIQYSTIVAEHVATRTAASLFDISHMGRLRFDGSRADQFLDRMLTRRVIDMQTGQVRYSLVCNESGGVLDDVLVYCLTSPSETSYFLMVVNASNRHKIVTWLQQHLSEFPDVTMRDTTESTAMIAIQGPKAMEICRGLFPAKCLSLGYYRCCVSAQMSKPVIVSRTGYTGEDGLELIVKADDAERVWDNLMLAGKSHGILPAGLGARDTLRLEAGMPLYGHELDEDIDPIQAGLDFAVNLKERQFVGSDALTKSKASSEHAVRIGLVLEGRRAARQNCSVLDSDSRTVGTVTSGSFSPTLDRPIAMAYVAKSVASHGLNLDVDIRGSRVSATVVALPFYKRPSI